MLEDLESAMDTALLNSLCAESANADGKQYRPKIIDFPGKQDVLHKIQKEETAEELEGVSHHGKIHSTRLSGSIAINMALDIEMQQCVVEPF